MFTVALIVRLCAGFDDSVMLKLAPTGGASATQRFSELVLSLPPAFSSVSCVLCRSFFFLAATLCVNKFHISASNFSAILLLFWLRLGRAVALTVGFAQAAALFLDRQGIAEGHV